MKIEKKEEVIHSTKILRTSFYEKTANELPTVIKSC